MARPSDGILLIDKPSGPTSHDVVAQVRRALAPGARGKDRPRVGHAGTLDPLATGLLVVMVGRGTRLAPFLSGLDKTYEAEVRFGVATDTLDRDGAVVATAPVPPSSAGLAAVLASLTGEIAQVPPIYSALKRDGRPLYRLARSGADVAPPPARRVTIHALALLESRWGEPSPATPDAIPAAPDGRLYTARLRVDCSSGTYVRSLARDLAVAFGTVGHLHALRRTRVGPFDLAGALPQAALDTTPLATVLAPLARSLPHLPRRTLAGEQAATLRRSGRLDPAWLDGDAMDHPCLLLDPAGDLVAISLDPDRLAAVFPDLAADEDASCA